MTSWTPRWRGRRPGGRSGRRSGAAARCRRRRRCGEKRFERKRDSTCDKKTDTAKPSGRWERHTRTDSLSAGRKVGGPRSGGWQSDQTHNRATPPIFFLVPQFPPGAAAAAAPPHPAHAAHTTTLTPKDRHTTRCARHAPPRRRDARGRAGAAHVGPPPALRPPRRVRGGDQHELVAGELRDRESTAISPYHLSAPPPS